MVQGAPRQQLVPSNTVQNRQVQTLHLLRHICVIAIPKKYEQEFDDFCTLFENYVIVFHQFVNKYFIFLLICIKKNFRWFWRESLLNISLWSGTATTTAAAAEASAACGGQGPAGQACPGPTCPAAEAASTAAASTCPTAAVAASPAAAACSGHPAAQADPPVRAGHWAGARQFAAGPLH